MNGYPRHKPLTPPVDRVLNLAELKEARPELFEPIPLTMKSGELTGTVAGWRSLEEGERIEIEDNDEPLVRVSDSEIPMFSTTDYAGKLDNAGYRRGEHLDGSALSQYVREGVANKLQEAQEKLPYGYRLIMFDGWRSLETQKSAYDLCYATLLDKLVEEGVIPEDGKDKLLEAVQELVSRETQNYISLPSPMPKTSNPSPEEVERGRLIPSPHNTGGSVDVAIVRIDEDKLPELLEIEESLKTEEDFVERAKLRFRLAKIYRLHSTIPDYGTGFDYAGQESALTAYEPESALTAFEGTDHEDDEAQDWRRMLYNVMTSVGFQPYSEEWWHYNFGNQMAARTQELATGQKQIAIYGGIDLDDQQKEYERLHDLVFEALIQAANNPADFKLPSELDGLVPENEFLKFSQEIGDPRKTRSLGQPHDMRYRGDIPDKLKQDIQTALAA